MFRRPLRGEKNKKNSYELELESKSDDTKDLKLKLKTTLKRV